MNRSLLSFIVALLVFVSQSAFAQTAPLDSKFQSWDELQLILPLSRKKDKKGKTIDRITAIFGGILRIGRSNFDLIDNRINTTLDFRVIFFDDFCSLP